MGRFLAHGAGFVGDFLSQEARYFRNFDGCCRWFIAVSIFYPSGMDRYLPWKGTLPFFGGVFDRDRGDSSGGHDLGVGGFLVAITRLASLETAFAWK